MNLGQIFTAIMAASAAAAGFVDARSMPNANSNARGHHLRGQRLNPLAKNAGTNLGNAPQHAQSNYARQHGLPTKFTAEEIKAASWAVDPEVADMGEEIEKLNADAVAQKLSNQGRRIWQEGEAVQTLTQEHPDHQEHQEQPSKQVIPSLDNGLSELLFDAADMDATKTQGGSNYDNTPKTAETAEEKAKKQADAEFDNNLALEPTSLPKGFTVVKTEGYKATFTITKGMSLVDVMKENFPEVPWDKLVPMEDKGEGEGNQILKLEKETPEHKHFVYNLRQSMHTPAFFDAVARAIKKYVTANDLGGEDRRVQKREIYKFIQILKIMKERAPDNRHLHEHFLNKGAVEGDVAFLNTLKEAPVPSIAAADELEPSTPSPEEKFEATLQAKIQEAAAKDRAEQGERGFDDQNFLAALRTLSSKNFSKIIDDIKKNPNVSSELAAEIINLLSGKINKKIAPKLAKDFVDHLETLLKRVPATRDENLLQELAAKVADLSYYQQHPLPLTPEAKQAAFKNTAQNVIFTGSFFTIAGLALVLTSMKRTRNAAYELAGVAGAGIVQAGNSMMGAVGGFVEKSLQRTKAGDGLHVITNKSV